MFYDRLAALVLCTVFLVTESHGQSPEPRPEIFIRGQTKSPQTIQPQVENYLARCIADPNDRISCHLARSEGSDGGLENYVQDGIAPSAYISCAGKGSVCLELATLDVGDKHPEPRMPSVDISIQFELDKAVVQVNQAGKLRQIARALKAKVNSGAKFAVIGHTDDTGTANYNCHLSQRRAKAVVEKLIVLGVSNGALKAVGVGESLPRNPKDGKAPENRRVGLARITKDSKSVLHSLSNLCTR